MMNELLEILQSALVTIVLAIISFLSYVIIATINLLKQKAINWFESKTIADQREILHRISEEAYARAEKIGKNKSYEAMEYVTKHMQQKGIPISEEEIQAAIEKAWIQFDKKNKAS